MDTLDDQPESKNQSNQFVILRIGKQIFAISVSHVVDVLRPHKINPIPLTSKDVLGSLNLRGRIVTAIDIRVILEMNEQVNVQTNMCVVVEYQGELFSLLVDEVRNVTSVFNDELIRNPDNLSKTWHKFSRGLFLLNDDLVVILDINKIMNTLMEVK